MLEKEEVPKCIIIEIAKRAEQYKRNEERKKDGTLDGHSVFKG